MELFFVHLALADPTKASPLVDALKSYGDARLDALIGKLEAQSKIVQIQPHNIVAGIYATNPPKVDACSAALKELAEIENSLLELFDQIDGALSVKITNANAVDVHLFVANIGSEIGRVSSQLDLLLQKSALNSDVDTKLIEAREQLAGIETKYYASIAQFYLDPDIQSCSAPQAPKGISNLGNSCYMNSALQALLAVPEFKEQIKHAEWPGIENIKTTAISVATERNQHVLVVLLAHLFEGWKSISIEQLDQVVTDDAKKNLSARAGLAIDDAFKEYVAARKLQRAMQAFVKQLDDSRNPIEMIGPATELRKTIFDTGIFGAEGLYSEQDASEVIELINRLLGNKLSYKTIREVPNTAIRSEKTEPMGVLQLPILQNQKGQATQAQDLCDMYFTPKQINDLNNAWEIDDAIHAEYQETVQLAGNPPQHLVLQYKRFETVFENGEVISRKIDNEIELPSSHILDFSKAFGVDNVNYKVISAVHHAGVPGGGHYMAFVEKDGEWYNINDSTISKPVYVEKSLSQAYMLVLERIS